MTKRSLVILFIIFIILGSLAGIFKHYYSFNYIFDSLYNKSGINPKATINPDQTYELEIWYYPFYRMVSEKEEEDYFQEVLNTVQASYPNIRFKLKELTFLKGKMRLQEAFDNGNPPDIYFNFSNDSLLNRRWQVAVEDYITKEERSDYSLIKWNQINNNNHLWGWPFLMQNQVWLVNNDLEEQIGENFLQDINNLSNECLLFNYNDDILLRQLLSLHGVKDITGDGEELNKELRAALKSIFTWIDNLRKKDIFASMSDNRMLKDFIEEDNVIIGPVNIWLQSVLQKRNLVKTAIYLPRRVQLFTINVFRQEEYKGDDHVRAAMEVAKIISQQFSQPLAEQFGIESAYHESGEENQTNPSESLIQLPEIYPSASELWYTKIIPVWLDFWENDLSVEEAVARLE